MSRKFKNKYRIGSARLKDWDYGKNGDYFITVCTHDKICFFGEIESQKMEMNIAGKIAEDLWHQIPQLFPFARLESFVVMPNHIHGILVIDNPNVIVEKEKK